MLTRLRDFVRRVLLSAPVLSALWPSIVLAWGGGGMR